MFDIGFQEMIMIFVVALVVVGPKRMPELGRTLGKGLGELKRSFDGIKAQVTAEMKEVEKEAKDDDLLSRPASDRSATPNITGETELTAGSEIPLKEEYQE